MITVGLDIGTTSISGLLYDLETQTVLHSITEEQASKPSVPMREWERLQDPGIILEQARHILSRLLTLEPEAVGIGLTGQMHGIVYTDERGGHLGPLYTWQDGRGGLLCGDENYLTYAHKISSLTGYSVAPGYGLATHYYNLQHELVPENAVSFCTIADYIAMRLVDGTVPLIDATQAAGIGGYHFQTGGFDKIALTQAGVDVSILPQVVPSGTVLGATPQGIPVYASLGDNQASFLGSVPLPGESLLLNIGTGSQLSAWLPKYGKVPSAMEVRPYPGGGVLLVGAALSGGKSYALLEGFYRQLITAYTGNAPADVYSLLDQLLQEDGYDENGGLKVNTQFMGTRADPGKRGSVEGITLDNFTPAGLAHAFLQGIINELHSFLNDLKITGAESFNHIVGSGNALRFNPVLREKAEAAFGLPLTLGAQVEEAAVGAALCAAVGSGAISSFEEAGAYLGDPLRHSSGGDEQPAPTLNAAVRNRIMNSYGLTAPQTADTVPETATDFPDNNNSFNTGGVVDIWPGQAIGPLRLGMNAAELEAAAQGFPAFYKVEFDGEGLVNFIEIGCPAEEWSCRYGEIELFSTKAAELADLLNLESPYDRQAAEGGCTYRFPEWGLTLWRSSGLTEEDLLTEEYTSLPPDILEDERRLLYFESVSVFRAGS